jgi:DNA polymerase III subunit epsilon
MLRFFNQQWDTVPLVVIDTETTGMHRGRDRAVQVGIARFENGAMVAARASFIDPGFPIPADATAIHGITDIAVAGMPTIEAFFDEPETQALLADSQPAAFNAEFDRYFVPPFQPDTSWPWVDPLVLVRKVDRYVRGSKRHRLTAACERYGIDLTNAHSADGDAKAAGELFFKLGREKFPKAYTMGRLLSWQRQQEAIEWARFNQWLSSQPPREATP